MCCLTVIHHQQQLPTPLVTVARWRSCPPCRTFCLGWPNPIAPLKSFCFAARNSLPVWRKVPNNMTHVTPPPLHPTHTPPSAWKCAWTSPRICSSRLQRITSSHNYQSQPWAEFLWQAGPRTWNWAAQTHLWIWTGLIWAFVVVGCSAFLWSQQGAGRCWATDIWLRKIS